MLLALRRAIWIFILYWLQCCLLSILLCHLGHVGRYPIEPGLTHHQQSLEPPDLLELLDLLFDLPLDHTPQYLQVGEVKCDGLVCDGLAWQHP